ncbi:MAG TPA: BMP family ABC transporter substrate-binding protein [bacterium]|nr:BMP family ABC transporter substrate-binding protein [bacterium]
MKRRALFLAPLLLAACNRPQGTTAPSPTPAAASSSAPSTSPAAPAAVKVGLVFDIGGRGDNSFNDSADRGLERAKKELGAEVEVLEPGDGSDRESALRQLASKNPDVVFGVGFLFTDDVNRVAADFPKVHFACVDYTVDPKKPIPPNVAALKFKEEEGSFLVGALSALVSKTHKVGFVGGMEIPLIKKFEAGFKAGVAAIDPKTGVMVKYAGVTGDAFKNPAKGKELALAIYGQGADVIFHASGSTGQGVFTAAKEQNKLAIGVDSDQQALAPGHVLTSMVKHVDVAVFETVKAAKAGKFQAGVQTFDLKSGGVDYVYDDKNKALIPDAARAKVEELRGKIVGGQIQVPYE